MKNRRDRPFRQKGKPSPKAPPPAAPAPSGPSSTDPLLQQAMALHQAGQFAEAEALYRQFLEASPNHPDALHLLGVLASQVGNGTVALEFIDRALLARPSFAEAHCSRANALYLLQQYEAAAESYDRAIRIKPDFAEACCNRANALHILKHYQAAFESADKAIRLKPDFAEAHNNRGNALHAMQRYVDALESYDQAIRLKPEFAEAHNNRGNTLHQLVQYQAAIASFDNALQLNPNYAEAQTNRHNSIQSLDRFVHLKSDYDYARETEDFATAVNETKRIAKLKGKAAMRAALEALPPDLRFHPALCNLASITFPKTDSSGRDLVFYCAPTRELWNPGTAESKGIGGSEEAVIWLSRLLHRRGWNVTVYTSCGLHAADYDGVQWKPYWMWNRRDRQDVTVIWRHPQFTSYEINSARVIVDLHDVIPEDLFTPERLAHIHRIFVKSTFHRALFPNIPDDKFVVVPNGIDASLFAADAPRDPLLLINTSSADRSMEAFVDCFEEIKQQVPGAKAQWAYGWGVWDAAFSSDPQRMQWKAKMQRRMAELGVEALGRISHDEVAVLYRRANIFFYPSEMAEIDCISLSKAMAAGAIPVTTDFAALGDKAGHGGVFIHSTKTKDDWAQPYQFHFEVTDPAQKTQFVAEAVQLLRHPPTEQDREPMRAWARAEFDWNCIADAWHHALTPSTSAETSPAPNPDRLLQQALAHHNAGELAQAEALYRQILATSPRNLGALHLLGVIACQTAQPARALEWIDRAIQVDPTFADAHINRGGALHSLGQYQAAIESYDTAIRLNPANADTHYNRGNALHALHQFQAAVESFDRAIQLKPSFADAWNNRGNSMLSLRQFAEAVASYDHAVQLNPRHAEAFHNRGSALNILQQYPAAIASYDQALQLNPAYADAWNNRGAALHVLLDHQAAIASFDQALRLNPNHADAHNNRGNSLLALKKYPAAVESYDRALHVNPNLDYLRGMRLHVKRYLCDWKNLDEELNDLEAAIARGERAAVPFTTLAVSDSPAIQLQAAEIYVRDKVPAQSVELPRRPRRDRLRIGYFSSDFYNHATSYLMAELFELHDRTRFEILGFSFGPDADDEMGARVSSAMDRFFDVRSMSDQDVAQLSRDHEVDIAVDLKGFTRNSRAGIFAWRAAPIQVNYLGYPGTMGAEYIDYLIADQTLIPDAGRRDYSEKIVTLPGSYQVNDSRRPLAAPAGTPADEGLPEGVFVFCCFNNAYKITPTVFDLWMRILARVESSVLWLFDDNPWANANLRKQAALRGIATERLIFARHRPLAEHMARHSFAHLLLDTAPYNAHTTASDALWTGLPVITRIGDTFAGRVAASLLRAVDLPELITETDSEFEDLAVALARDPQRLHALRRRLEENRATAPLFDTPAFTRHLEAAYEAMAERHHAALPPGHIEIAASLSSTNNEQPSTSNCS